MTEKKFSYKIRKGLETPLCIQGMEVRYFYLLAATFGVAIMFSVFLLIAAINAMTLESFLRFIGGLFISFFVLVFMKLYFTSKTGKNKQLAFAKSTKVKTISNIDIMKSIK
jgi:hypothetical protein